MLKKQTTAPEPEDDPKLPDFLHEFKNPNQSNQEFWLNAMYNMHSFLLEKKPHIKEYKRIRHLHSEIVSGMMDYYDNDKFERKIDADYFPPEKFGNTKEERTVHILETTFDFETKVGNNAFFDMQIYKPAPNMNSITEEFINSHRYRKPEKVEFLQSMLDSKLGLFEITAVDDHEGYAYLKEVFTGEEYKIIDIGLSGSRAFGNQYIYTRIITYHGISFGTGLNFVFNKTDPFIQKFIKRQKVNYSPLGEFVRFTELFNRYSTDENSVKTVAHSFK